DQGGHFVGREGRGVGDVAVDLLAAAGADGVGLGGAVVGQVAVPAADAGLFGVRRGGGEVAERDEPVVHVGTARGHGVDARPVAVRQPRHEGAFVAFARVDVQRR